MSIGAIFEFGEKLLALGISPAVQQAAVTLLGHMNGHSVADLAKYAAEQKIAWEPPKK